MGGSVIVSVVLRLPTLETVLLDAVLEQAASAPAPIILMLGVLTAIGTLVPDMLPAVIDPRIKFKGR